MSDAPAATAGHAHDHKDDGEVHVHISSTRFYIGVLLALLVLTGITVSVALVNLDWIFPGANAAVAVIIATMKAGLVAAFFMHLRHDKLFNTYAFLGAFLFLAIFLLLTHDDLGTRAQVDEDYGSQRLPQSGEIAPASLGSAIESMPMPSAEPAGSAAPAPKKE
jgi:cytochrome c oxidase subunit 4